MCRADTTEHSKLSYLLEKNLSSVALLWSCERMFQILHHHCWGWGPACGCHLCILLGRTQSRGHLEWRECEWGGATWLCDISQWLTYAVFQWQAIHQADHGDTVSKSTVPVNDIIIGVGLNITWPNWLSCGIEMKGIDCVWFMGRPAYYCKHITVMWRDRYIRRLLMRYCALNWF